MDKQIEQMEATFNQIASTAASIKQMLNLVIGDPAMMTEDECNDVLAGAQQLAGQIGWMADIYGGFVGGPERWMLPRSCHPEVEHDQELAEATVLDEQGREMAGKMDEGERIRFVASVRRFKDELTESRPHISEARRTTEAQILAVRYILGEDGRAEIDALIQSFADKRNTDAEGSPATAEEEGSHHVE